MEGLAAELWDSFQRLEYRKQRIAKLLGYQVPDRVEDSKFPRLPRIILRPCQFEKSGTATARTD